MFTFRYSKYAFLLVSLLFSSFRFEMHHPFPLVESCFLALGVKRDWISIPKYKWLLNVTMPDRIHMLFNFLVLGLDQVL